MTARQEAKSVKHRTHTIALILLLTAIVAGASVSAAKSRKPTDADLKKAEALFIEAAAAEDDGRLDDSYMLLRRAAELNPDDPYIKGSLAEFVANLPTPDSLMKEQAYADIEERFRANPSDQHNAYVFAALASSHGRIDDLIGIWETLDSILPSRTDPALNLATALLGRYSHTLDTADYNRAISIYERLEDGAGPSVMLSSRKISAYMLRKDSAAIEREIVKLAASAPGDVETKLVVAKIYEGLGKPQQALACLDSAQTLEPSNGKIYLTRALIYQAEKDSAAYDREVSRALQAPAVEFGDKFSLLSDYVVKLYTDSAQRPRIEQMFETLQEVNPGEAALHALYGAYKASIEEYPAAAEQFSYSVDLDPTNKGVWQNLMQVAGSLKDNDLALNTARKSLKFFPGDPYFSISGAMALAFKDMVPQALALLDSINPEEVPNNKARSSIEATRGDLLHRAGLRDSAYAAYHKAIEEDAENYMALNNCAYFMAVDSIDLDRAELYISIATAAEADNPTYLDTYAWVAFQKHDYAKAREAIDKALAAYGIADGKIPEDFDKQDLSAEVFDHAGDIYFMTGDRAKAVNFWKEALSLDPENKLIEKKVHHRTIFFE